MMKSYSRRVTDVARKGLVSVALAGAVSCVSGADIDKEGVRTFPPLPPPGVHPRVLFTDADKPAMKARAEDTAFGQKVIQPHLKKFTQDFLSGSEGVRKWDGQGPTAALCKKYFIGSEGFTQATCVAAYNAWLNDDPELTAELVDWAEKYAKLLLASKELDPGNSFWREKDEMGRDWHLGDEQYLKGLAFTYDFLFNAMAKPQQDLIRQAIAEGIKDRISHGLGWGELKQFSNHSPLHGKMGLIALSIEGEEGYQKKTYDMWVKLLRDWITKAISKKGVNHEDGYIYYALRGGAPMMLAAQRRGEKLFNIPNYHNMFRWQAHWEPVNLTGRELGGYQTFHVINKYMYPNDPLVNSFWARRVGRDYGENMAWQSMFDTVAFGTDYDGDYDVVSDPANLGLEKMIFDPRRGVMIARNGWQEDDLQFRFSARPDNMFVGHAAADSGSFDLNAFGRKWVYNNVGDKAASFSSKDFSLVHIDGKAEGMKPPTVKTLKVADNDAAAGITVDLTYAYNWVWHYYWIEPTRNGFPDAPWVQEKANPYDLGWPQEEDWLPTQIYDQPEMGFIGIWQYKKRINQVDRVFRTAIMVRGENPYVLIVDDVKKDDQPHLYEWYLQTAEDLTIATMQHQDIYLRPKDEERIGTFAPIGSERMLVRTLGPWEDFPKTQPMAYKRANWHTDARMEDHMYGPTGNRSRGQYDVKMGRRLVIPYRGTDGDFVVLLYPYRTTMAPTSSDRDERVELGKAWHDNPAGAPMPQTTWNEDRTQLTVQIGEQRDVFTFKKLASGRTEVSMEREGEGFCGLCL
jgi:hypothetical protein